MSPCERHHFAQTGTSARIGPLALRHVGDQVGTAQRQRRCWSTSKPNAGGSDLARTRTSVDTRQVPAASHESLEARSKLPDLRIANGGGSCRGLPQGVLNGVSLVRLACAAQAVLNEAVHES